MQLYRPILYKSCKVMVNPVEVTVHIHMKYWIKAYSMAANQSEKKT